MRWIIGIFITQSHLKALSHQGLIRRGDIAESKCNGDALHAFYELRGLVYEERERFEGRLDRDGQLVA